jgi:hypothetical protein
VNVRFRPATLKPSVLLRRLLESAGKAGARFPDLDSFLDALKSMDPRQSEGLGLKARTYYPEA